MTHIVVLFEKKKKKIKGSVHTKGRNVYCFVIDIC